MKNSLKILGVGLFIAAISACTLGPSKDERHPAAALTAGDYSVRELTNERILQYSSSGNLRMGELKILTDNTDALEGKLDIIRKARNEIDLMYYIYSADESSSYMTRELLRAAERGVKVRILVDFFVNYARFDYFKMLEEKSRGNIQVSFYGVPQGVLLESMSYIVSPCAEQNKTCVEKKWKEIRAQHAAGKVPFFTKLLVAGMYTKSADLLKIAVSEGAQLDLGGSDKLSQSDKAELMNFLELVFKAKIKGDIGAKLKLGMALAFYGDKTLPVYEKLLAVLPLVGGSKELAQSWESATDFIHHKLIIADRRYVQLGGRNIEDSYHMAVSPSGKYTFLDTDVNAEVIDGGDEIKNTFDKMWRFSDSVKTLKGLDSVVTHNFNVRENLPVLVGAIKACESQKPTPNYGACIESASSSQLVVNMAQRVKKAEDELIAKAAAYDARKIVNSNPSSVVMNDADPFITYIENLSFTRKSLKRLYGSGGDKNISELWIQAIKNTCKQASVNSPKEITLLNAYVFMPAAVLATLGDVVSGRIRCANTTITIATNSKDSTDLAPINLFATYQFLNLAKAVSKNSKVNLRILEMKRPAGKTTYSLHTKASIFGDDLVIGSANADIRSYHMDSNNGFFIRNAPEFAAQYREWVNNFINPANGRFEDKTAVYRSVTAKQAYAISGQAFDEAIAKYGKKLSQSTKAKTKKLFLDMCVDVNSDSEFFLSQRLKSLNDRERQRQLQPRMESFDSKYQIF